MKYRFFIALLSVLFLSQTIFASARNREVRVTVVEDKGGDSLPGTVVGFPDYGIWAVTDENGFAVLKSVPEGRAKITARMVGMLDFELVTDQSDIVIRMKESTFWLDEVKVVAKANQTGASTSSSISRAAIDHLQATSLSDVMELLPGQLASNPSLTGVSKASIRQVNTDALGSLGTSIVVNGAPVSNNANLQVGNTATDGTLTGFASTAGSGIDLRQISVDNVESVDVIRGIPSVEYGDLTSGVIIVNHKAGEFPFQVRTKINPTLTQASVGKGFRLGKNGGALSADFDYASSLADERRPYQQYRRISGNLLYTRLFGSNINMTAGAGVNSDIDAQKLDPTDVKYQRTRTSENLGFKANANVSVQVNRKFLKSLKFNASASYSRQIGYVQELKGNFGYMVTSAMTDGTVASNVDYPVCDVQGNHITNTEIPGHQASTNILPYEFLTRMSTRGKPLNLFAKGVANMYTEFWGIGNRMLAGIEWKTDVNFGEGKVFDPLFPPTAGIRMRSYREIPALNQASAYFEDNMGKTLLDRELKLQAGLRFDAIQPGRNEGGMVLSPRFNASYELVPGILSIKGGWGINAKAPPLVYLYPDKAYFDFVNFSNIGLSGIPQDKALSVITTKVFDTSNASLKIARNRKSEIGLECTVKDMRLSLTAYSERLTDGYSFGLNNKSFHTFELKKYRDAGTGADGRPVLAYEKSTNVVLSSNRPLNNRVNESSGIEFDFDFGQIRPIHTSFVLSGALMRSDSYSTLPSYYQKTPDVSTGEYKDIGVYAAGDGSRYDRLSSNLRIIHNIPAIGFVISLSVQTIWMDTHEYLGTDNIYPIGWISASNLKYTPLNPGEDYSSDIQKPILDKRLIKEVHDPLWLCNLRVTKEIGDLLGFTFFLNNMFNNNPLEESRRNPGVFTTRNPSQFFGVEAWIKF